MDAQRHQQISELFQALCDLPPTEQTARLERECADDVDLRRAVEGLLLRDGDPGGLLDERALRTGFELRSPVSAHENSRQPLRIGHYRILRSIGVGGMGTVFEAEQDHPRRTVALKIIRPGIASTAMMRRFDQEADILGRLLHPGIAQIHEAGIGEVHLDAAADNAADSRDDALSALQVRSLLQAGLQPFFAMEFVRGVPLNVYAERQQLGARQRMELMAKVCDAVHHAHLRGVIHRDLKPANILVTDEGQPKILDFGVARAMDADVQTVTTQTDSGQLMGTVPYMSPEQVSGDARQIDIRTDVYTLGVLLYELLAGRLPYDVTNRSFADAFQVIREHEPSRLSSMNRLFRGDIETIVAKALEKDRASRYGSAGDLAADIRRYLNAEPLVARPASAFYHLRKFARRNKVLVGGVAATIAALALGLIGTTHWAQRELRQRNEAERQTYRAMLASAAAALRENDVSLAESALANAPQHLRGWEWSHFDSRLDDSLMSWAARSPLQTGAWFDDDPNVMCTLSAGFRVGVSHTRSEQGIVRLWRIGADHPVAERHVDFGRIALRFDDLVSADGRFLIRRESESFDVIEDVATGTNAVRVAIPHNEGEPAQAIAASRDANPLLYEIGGRLIVVDRSSGEQRQLEGNIGVPAECAAFSNDAKLVACGVGSMDNPTIMVWDAVTGKQRHAIRGQTETVTALAFSPDAARLVNGNAGGELWFWDTQSGRPADWEMEAGQVDRIESVAYHPSGDLIATGGQDRNVTLWNARTGRAVSIFSGHRAIVSSVRFSPDGSTLVSSDWDATVRLWEVPGLDPRVLRGHKFYVYPVAFSPDGARIFTGGWDGTVRVWDADSGDEIAAMRHPAGLQTVCISLAVSPDGRRLVVPEILTDGLQTRSWIRLIDINSGHTESTFAPQEGGWQSVAFDPTGRRIAAAHPTGVYFWEVDSLRPLPTPAPFPPNARCVNYSHNGHVATIGFMNGDVVLIDGHTLESIATLSGHTTEVFSLAFSPDDTLLATASGDRTIRIWDVRAARAIAVLHGHTDPVHCVAFSPDGRRLASGSNDRTIRLWDTQSFEEVAQLRGHDDHIWSLAWSPDGRRLVSGSGDFTARIWEVDPVRKRLQARRDRAALLPQVRSQVRELLEGADDVAAVVDKLRRGPALNSRQREIALQCLLAEIASGHRAVAPPNLGYGGLSD